MTNTTSPTGTNQTQFDRVWGHLDCLLNDDGVNILTNAAESIEAVARALRDSRPVHADVMARLLDSVANEVRAAHQHVGCAIVELGELGYHQG